MIYLAIFHGLVRLPEGTPSNVESRVIWGFTLCEKMPLGGHLARVQDRLVPPEEIFTSAQHAHNMD